MDKKNTGFDFLNGVWKSFYGNFLDQSLNLHLGSWEKLFKDWKNLSRDNLGNYSFSKFGDGLDYSDFFAKGWEGCLGDWRENCTKLMADWQKDWLEFYENASKEGKIFDFGGAFDFWKNSFFKMDRLEKGKNWDCFENYFLPFYSSPRLGSTREIEKKYLHWIEGLHRFVLLNQEMQSFLIDLFVKAWEEWHKKNDKKIDAGLNDFIDSWIGAADSVFIEGFKSDAFLKLQGRYINALMRLRLGQSEFMEEFCKLFHLPSRVEMDRVHETNYLQAKEISLLKKELIALGKKIEKEKV